MQYIEVLLYFSAVPGDSVDLSENSYFSGVYGSKSIFEEFCLNSYKITDIHPRRISMPGCAHIKLILH